MTPFVPISFTLSGLEGQAEHGPSKTRLRTTPPADNGGKGDAFSPTDLVGAALVSCALTTCALIAAKEGLSWGPNASGTVEKHMTPPPRRIGQLVAVLQMPKEVKPEHRARLEEIARGCPVARSLHPDVQVPFAFRW